MVLDDTALDHILTESDIAKIRAESLAKRNIGLDEYGDGAPDLVQNGPPARIQTSVDAEWASLMSGVDGIRPTKFDPKGFRTASERTAERRANMGALESSAANVYNFAQQLTTGVAEVAAAVPELAGQVAEFATGSSKPSAAIMESALKKDREGKPLTGEEAQAVAWEPNFLRSLSSSIRKIAEYDDRMLDGDGQPLQAQSFLAGAFSQGLGSAAGFMGGGAALKAAGVGSDLLAIGGLGAIAEGQSMYREAEDAGATPQQKAIAMLIGMGAGSTEVVGASGIIMRLNKAAGGSLMRSLSDPGLIPKIMAEGGEEAGQEFVQQLVEDAGRQYLAKYGENKTWNEMTAMAFQQGALPAFLVGGLLGAGAAVDLASTQKQATKKVAADIGETGARDLGQAIEAEPQQSVPKKTPEQAIEFFREGNIDTLEKQLKATKTPDGRSELEARIQAVRDMKFRTLGEQVEGVGVHPEEAALVGTLTTLQEAGAKTPDVLVADSANPLPMQGMSLGGQIVIDGSQAGDVLRGVIFHEAFHHAVPVGSKPMKALVLTAREQFPELMQRLRVEYLRRYTRQTDEPPFAEYEGEERLAREFEEAFAIGAELMPDLIQEVLGASETFSEENFAKNSGLRGLLQAIRDFVVSALNKLPKVNLTSRVDKERAALVRELSGDLSTFDPKQLQAFAEALSAAYRSAEPVAFAKAVQKITVGDVLARGQTDFYSAERGEAFFDEQAAIREEAIQELISIGTPRADAERKVDVMYSVADSDANSTIFLSSRFGARVESVLADNLIHLRNLQATLEVPEGGNWDREDTRSSGLLMHAVNEFQEQFVTPLVRAMSDGNISIEAVHLYLAALTSLERNETLIKRDQAADPKDRKHFGREVNPGAWLRESEANAIIKASLSGEKAKYFRRVRRLNAAMHESKLKLIERSGLEPQEVIDKTRALGWKNYSPMKTLMRGRPGISRGRGFSINGKTVARMTGRRTEPDNVLIAGVMDYISVLTRVEKNRVITSLAKLVEANPDPTLWEIVKGSLADVRMTGQDEIEAGEEANIYRALWDARIPTADSAVGFMRDGKQNYIVFHPRGKHLADALTGANLFSVGSLLRPFGTINRYYAAANTSWSLNFIVDNFRRDAMLGGIRIALDLSVKDAAKVVSSAPAAVRALLTGKGGQAALVEAYVASGAKTGHFWGGDFAEQRRGLERQLKRAQAATGLIDRTGRGFSALVGLVSHVNDAIENGIRFAYWQHLVRDGMSHEDAAVKTKELTINFNKRGRLAPILGPLYLFFNASMRGSVAIRDMVREHPRKIVGGLFSLGVFLDLLNYMLSGDDDDGENAWDARGEFEKDRYLMVPDGSGGFLKLWSMPYGLNAFVTMGRQFSMMLRGAASPGGALSAAMASAIDSFNPLGGSGGELDKAMGHMVSPTAFDPFLDVAMNDNFAGRRIYNDFADSNVKADAYTGWESTSGFWHGMAQELNALGGGDRIRSGGNLDVHPETLRHLWKQIGGGIWRDATNMTDAFSSLVSGDFVEAFNIAPVTSKFHTSEYHEKFLSSYYDNIAAIDQAAKVAGTEDLKLNREERALANLEGERKRITRYVKAMNTAIDQADDPAEAESLTLELKTEVRAFNRAISDARKTAREANTHQKK